jgi:predicted negative regulator of RcsB-dependent stress response
MLGAGSFQLSKIFIIKMSNELESQIKESLFKEKIEKFYKKNKILIIVFFIILIVTPIFIQINSYLNKKNNENLLEQYLKAESLIKKDDNQALEILENLTNSQNQTIQKLALNRTVDIYLNQGQKDKALLQFEKVRDFDNKLFDELNNIKQVILKFDTIKESEILDLLKIDNKNDSFILIKKKLLYDFYIKSNQLNKAKQISDQNK